MPFNVIDTIIIAVVVVAYVAFVWRISILAKPIRERLFVLADEVAHDEMLPLNRVEYVDALLERAISPLEAVRLALFLVPLSAFRVAYVSVRHAMGITDTNINTIAESSVSLRRFYTHVVYSACMANPLFGVVVVIELFLIAIFGVMPGKLVTAAIRSANDNPIRHNGIA